MGVLGDSLEEGKLDQNPLVGVTRLADRCQSFAAPEVPSRLLITGGGLRGLPLTYRSYSLLAVGSLVLCMDPSLFCQDFVSGFLDFPTTFKWEPTNARLTSFRCSFLHSSGMKFTRWPFHWPFFLIGRG